jgi:predicted RNase H-like nuclease (RuvC/YqgF family)
MTAWGGKSMESRTPEEQAETRLQMADVKVGHFQSENEALRRRIKLLEACLGRDMLDVFEELEQLRREHEEMRLRLRDWQAGGR